MAPPPVRWSYIRANRPRIRAGISATLYTAVVTRKYGRLHTRPGGVTVQGVLGWDGLRVRESGMTLLVIHRFEIQIWEWGRLRTGIGREQEGQRRFFEHIPARRAPAGQAGTKVGGEKEEGGGS